MPLKLWLPLDGTSENRGISGVTMSGSPASWGNGRTGKCAVFNDNTGNVIYNDTTEFNYAVEDFSWAMWLKRDQSAMTATAMFAFSVGRPDYGDNRGYGLAVHSANTLRFWFGYSNYDVTGFPNNEWHHVAFTRKGTTLKMYLDGVLKSTKTYSGATPTFGPYGPGIGCFHYNGNIYPLIGAISDFRIYNHTLSAKEVYELSRALIVHYPLSAPGNANTNLLTWTKNYTEASPLVHTSSASDGIKYLGNDSLVIVTPGKDYYIQVKSTAIPGTHGGSGAVTNNFTIFLYQRNQGTSKAIGSYDTAPNLNKNNIFINDPDRQLYVWKWTAPSNAQDITLRTNSYSDGTTAVTLKFWDFKIEEGTYTSYVPSKNSAQYGELGYGTGIVRDVSGHGYDLTYSGTGYLHESVSPRYATAINFNQSAYLYNNSFEITVPQFSVAFWLKPNASASAQHFIFGIFDSWANDGIGMFRNTDTKSYQTVMKSTAESSHGSTGTITYDADVWTHVAITWNGTTMIVYQNAATKVTKTYGLSGDCLLKRIYLGNSMFNTHPTSETDEAAMSDFRLYGTALTADDVKYLYETSAAIDNNGDMFADSFEETEMLPRVGQEGLVYGSHLSESGGTIAVYQNTSKGLFDPNTKKWSYTPAADTNNSCMDFGFFCPEEGVTKYHITMVVEWSGFADILTTNPDFTINFHGPNYIIGGTTYEWTTNPISSALYAVKTMQSLVTGAASGVYKYEADFTLSSGWLNSYWACYVGFRTNYSNGTGKITASKLRIYPADEHMTNTASLCSSGDIQVRLADEVGLA